MHRQCLEPPEENENDPAALRGLTLPAPQEYPAPAEFSFSAASSSLNEPPASDDAVATNESPNVSSVPIATSSPDGFPTPDAVPFSNESPAPVGSVAPPRPAYPDESSAPDEFTAPVQLPDTVQTYALASSSATEANRTPYLCTPFTSPSAHASASAFGSTLGTDLESSFLCSALTTSRATSLASSSAVDAYRTRYSGSTLTLPPSPAPVSTSDSNQTPYLYSAFTPALTVTSISDETPYQFTAFSSEHAPAAIASTSAVDAYRAPYPYSDFSTLAHAPAPVLATDSDQIPHFYSAVTPAPALTLSSISDGTPYQNMALNSGRDPVSTFVSTSAVRACRTPYSNFSTLAPAPALASNSTIDLVRTPTPGASTSASALLSSSSSVRDYAIPQDSISFSVRDRAPRRALSSSSDLDRAPPRASTSSSARNRAPVGGSRLSSLRAWISTSAIDSDQNLIPIASSSDSACAVTKFLTSNSYFGQACDVSQSRDRDQTPTLVTLTSASARGRRPARGWSPARASNSAVRSDQTPTPVASTSATDSVRAPVSSQPTTSTSAYNRPLVMVSNPVRAPTLSLPSTSSAPAPAYAFSLDGSNEESPFTTRRCPHLLKFLSSSPAKSHSAQSLSSEPCPGPSQHPRGMLQVEAKGKRKRKHNHPQGQKHSPKLHDRDDHKQSNHDHLYSRPQSTQSAQQQGSQQDVMFEETSEMSQKMPREVFEKLSRGHPEGVPQPRQSVIVPNPVRAPTLSLPSTSSAPAPAYAFALDGSSEECPFTTRRRPQLLNFLSGSPAKSHSAQSLSSEPCPWPSQQPREMLQVEAKGKRKRKHNHPQGQKHSHKLHERDDHKQLNHDHLYSRPQSTQSAQQQGSQQDVMFEETSEMSQKMPREVFEKLSRGHPEGVPQPRQSVIVPNPVRAPTLSLPSTSSAPPPAYAFALDGSSEVSPFTTRRRPQLLNFLSGSPAKSHSAQSLSSEPCPWPSQQPRGMLQVEAKGKRKRKHNHPQGQKHSPKLHDRDDHKQSNHDNFHWRPQSTQSAQQQGSQQDVMFQETSEEMSQKMPREVFEMLSRELPAGVPQPRQSVIVPNPVRAPTLSLPSTSSAPPPAYAFALDGSSEVSPFTTRRRPQLLNFLSGSPAKSHSAQSLSSEPCPGPSQHPRGMLQVEAKGKRKRKHNHPQGQKHSPKLHERDDHKQLNHDHLYSRPQSTQSAQQQDSQQGEMFQETSEEMSQNMPREVFEMLSRGHPEGVPQPRQQKSRVQVPEELLQLAPLVPQFLRRLRPQISALLAGDAPVGQDQERTLSYPEYQRLFQRAGDSENPSATASSVSSTLRRVDALDSSVKELFEETGRARRETEKTRCLIESVRALEPRLEETFHEAVSKNKNNDAETSTSPLHDTVQKSCPSKKEKSENMHATLEKLRSQMQYSLFKKSLNQLLYRMNKKKGLKYLFTRRGQRNSQLAEFELQEPRETADHSRICPKCKNMIKDQMQQKSSDKYRSIFENEFPDIRKRRQARERQERAYNRTENAGGLEDGTSDLDEVAMFERVCRNAVQLPKCEPLPSKDVDSNKDPMDNFEEDWRKRLKYQTTWSDVEKSTFKENYLKNPKKFGVIASFLESKSAQDCVAYYYLSKKKENYKRLLRNLRRNRSTDRNAEPQPSTSSAVNSQNTLRPMGRKTGQNKQQPFQKKGQKLGKFPEKSTAALRLRGVVSDSTSNGATLTAPCSENSSLSFSPANMKIPLLNYSNDMAQETAMQESRFPSSEIRTNANGIATLDPTTRNAELQPSTSSAVNSQNTLRPMGRKTGQNKQQPFQKKGQKLGKFPEKSTAALRPRGVVSDSTSNGATLTAPCSENSSLSFSPANMKIPLLNYSNDMAQETAMQESRFPSSEIRTNANGIATLDPTTVSFAIAKAMAATTPLDSSIASNRAVGNIQMPPAASTVTSATLNSAAATVTTTSTSTGITASAITTPTFTSIGTTNATYIVGFSATSTASTTTSTPTTTAASSAAVNVRARDTAAAATAAALPVISSQAPAGSDEYIRLMRRHKKFLEKFF